MPYNTWDANAAASQTGTVNTSLDGLNVAEGCPAGGMNAAVRMLMANVRQLFNLVPDVSTLMPKSGGPFTGDITRSTRGAYLHHKSTSYLSGIIHETALGAPQPSGMAVGDYWEELE